MISNRRYMLNVAVITLIGAILIGVIIALATGDLWRGVRIAVVAAIGAMVWQLVLWAVGRAGGRG